MPLKSRAIRLNEARTFCASLQHLPGRVPAPRATGGMQLLANAIPEERPCSDDISCTHSSALRRRSAFRCAFPARPMSRFQGNVAEIRLGQMAAQRTQNDAVRKLGETLRQDHSVALQRANRIAESMPVEAPAEPSAGSKRKHDSLAKLSGRKFRRRLCTTNGRRPRGIDRDISRPHAERRRCDCQLGQGIAARARGPSRNGPGA